MFCKTGELKKIMKASLKRCGLFVCNVNDHYLVYADDWGIYVNHVFASNKFKAAIMELIGDIPEPGECYHYTIDADKGLVSQTVMDVVEPYKSWMQAKDYGAITPIHLSAWLYEYIVVQRKSDYQFITVRRSLTSDVISSKELETASEHMPGRPSILDGKILYFKNESTIYWVHTEPCGRKVREVLFPLLNGISFFDPEWKREELDASNELEDDKMDEVSNEELNF